MNPPTLRQFSVALSCATLAIALAALAGWAFQVEILKSVVPGAATMKFNTAAGLLVASIALAGTSEKNGVSLVAGRLGAGLIVLLGGLTISEYLVKWEDDRFDNLFVRETQQEAQLYPGRMAPQTALCFLMFGAAVLMRESRSNPSRSASRALTACVSIISVTALTGHLYGSVFFYGLSELTGMAIHTAFAFMLLSVGLFIVQRDEGIKAVYFSETLGGLTARRLFPPSLLLPFLLGWILLAGERAGLYDSAAASALFVIGIILLFSWTIALMADKLHRLDLDRERSEESRRQTIEDLSHALQQVQSLRGLLPMCAWCNRIRDNSGGWNDVTFYLSKYTQADISHGICPECARRHFPNLKKDTTRLH